MGKGSCNGTECDNHKYFSEGAELSVKVDFQGSPYNHINFTLYEPEDGSKVHDASSLLNEENGNTTFSTEEFISLSTKRTKKQLSQSTSRLRNIGGQKIILCTSIS